MKLFFTSRAAMRAFKRAYKGSYVANVVDNGKGATQGKRYAVQLNKGEVK